MPRQELHCYIIVHGEKPDSTCSIHREFIRRLDKAIKYAQKGTFDGIIITGGITRKNCPSEASMGAEYLRDKTGIPIIIEEASHTTIENIRFTKQLIAQYAPDTLTVVSSAKRMFRIKYLYGQLWPEMQGKFIFVSSSDSYSMFFFALEMIYLVYALLDIGERFIPHITKQLFRNG
ncbi:MAG: YdcF family protein [Patescibacteria group bacterium]|jgi:uncharacterized SAM-binding protein YcdF (DUF218 family)